MDPLSQGLLGAAAAQAVYGRVLPRSAWWIGMGAGMAADLDVFIRVSDPIANILIHRGFTHGLLFVPTGGLLCALVALWHPAFRGHRNDVIAAAILAYLTHPLLDALTSYGTSLYWPLSDARVAWDAISVIDPIFTLTLLVAVVWAAVKRAKKPAVIGLAIAGAYVGLGFIQHERAEGVQQRLADARGHAIERGRVMPSLGNLIVWRSVYQDTQGRLHADAVRVVPWGGTQSRGGVTVPGVNLARIETGDDATDRAIYRYNLFTDGYTAFTPGAPDVIGDMRYSRDPGGFQPIWGVRVDEHTIVPVSIRPSRDNLWPDLRRQWWEVVNGFETPDVETASGR